MSNEWGEITYRVEWPSGVESDMYEAGEQAEYGIQWSSFAPPVPAVGEEIVFDDDREPTERNPTQVRFLIGTVGRREWAFNEERSSGQLRRSWSVILVLENVRRWEP